uniref:Uncharacterized protein n=1 Tax=Arundo donax TaxID=35708 RepID=A0A0A9D1T7_ARUDO
MSHLVGINLVDCGNPIFFPCGKTKVFFLSFLLSKTVQASYSCSSKTKVYPFTDCTTDCAIQMGAQTFLVYLIYAGSCERTTVTPRCACCSCICM